MKNTGRISCVIPAYNEAARIGAVLQAAVGHPLLSEIIVVDDGSTDGTTALVARDFPSVRRITHARNLGKSAAVANGIREASGEIIMMLDADLDGLTQADIAALAEPVLAGDADMTISLRKNAEPVYHMMKLDFISGERVFPKTMVLDMLEDIGALAPFGFEIWLNQKILETDKRVRVVPLPGVSHTRKTGKHGYLGGALNELHMIQNMQKTASFPDLIEQYYRLWQKTRTGES